MADTEPTTSTEPRDPRGRNYSQGEIARVCGVCRQAIAAIETRALKKVRLEICQRLGRNWGELSRNSARFLDSGFKKPAPIAKPPRRCRPTSNKGTKLLGPPASLFKFDPVAEEKEWQRRLAEIPRYSPGQDRLEYLVLRIAHGYGVSVEELLTGPKTMNVCQARYALAGLALKFTKLRVTEIGRRLGKDHSVISSWLKSFRRSKKEHRDEWMQEIRQQFPNRSKIECRRLVSVRIEKAFKEKDENQSQGFVTQFPPKKGIESTSRSLSRIKGADI